MKKQLFAIVLILSYKLNGVGLRVARAKPIPNYGNGYSLSEPSSPYGYNGYNLRSMAHERVIYSSARPISVTKVKVSKISVTDNLGNTYTCNNKFLIQNATYSNFRFDNGNGRITLNRRFTGPRGSEMVGIGETILKNCTLNQQLASFKPVRIGYDQPTPQEIRNSRK